METTQDMHQHQPLTSYPTNQVNSESVNSKENLENIIEQDQHIPKESPINEKENLKNQKIESQMKKIGFSLNGKNTDKNQFAKNLANIIGNFFNPLINTIAQKQRKVCQKLGFVMEKPEDQKIKRPINSIEEEAKIQSQDSIKANKKVEPKKSLLDENVKKQFIQNLKAQQKQEKQAELRGERKPLKRRIIRKIIKPSQSVLIKRTHEEKVLVKQMEKNFDCKLKNNRLYMKGMPKKPVSSFFFFFKDYSTKLHQENHQLQTSKQVTYGSALAKRISQRWKQMTDEQKKPYMLMSVKTRKAYQQSMEAFKNQNKAVFESFKKIKRIKANETRRIKIQRDSFSSSQNQDGEQIQVEIQVEQNSESPQVEKAKSKASQGNSMQPIDLENQELQIVIPEDEEQKPTQKGRFSKSRQLRQRFRSVHKPKSPSPSFFFFYNQKKAQISIDHGVTRGARITQIASGMWKLLTDEQKRPYEILADDRRKKYYEQMKQFQLEHPEEWAQMQAYKRKVATNNLHGKRKKVVQPEPEQDIGQNDEQNSESFIVETQRSPEIDSLEGHVIDKPHANLVDQKVKSNSEKAPIKIIEQKSKQGESQTKKEDNKPSPSRKRPHPKVKDQQDKNEDQQNGDYKEHRPKAPASSFFMFYKMNNSILADQFKESNGGKLVQYASEIWKNMTESEKRPYEMQAEESRQKYYKAMQAYKEKYPEEIKQRKLDLKKKHEKQVEEGLIPKKRKKPSSIKNTSNPDTEKLNHNSEVKNQSNEN